MTTVTSDGRGKYISFVNCSHQGCPLAELHPVPDYAGDEDFIEYVSW